MPSPLESTKKSKVLLKASFGNDNASGSSSIYCAKKVAVKDGKNHHF